MSGRNYIDLISLKAANILEKQNLNIILNDDIWDKETLIIKSGGYLTESLITKLINFGIREVSVDFAPEEQDAASLLQDFTKTQSALIIADNLADLGWLDKNLIDAGFDKKNIFLTDNYNSINKFFRSRVINIIFISSVFYEKSHKCVDKYSLLRNTHAFVILEENESARKLKTGYNSHVKFLIKPLYAKRLKFFINQAVNQNFLDFHMDEAQIS